MARSYIIGMHGMSEHVNRQCMEEFFLEFRAVVQFTIMNTFKRRKFIKLVGTCTVCYKKVSHDRSCSDESRTEPLVQVMSR